MMLFLVWQNLRWSWNCLRRKFIFAAGSIYTPPSSHNLYTFGNLYVCGCEFHSMWTFLAFSQRYMFHLGYDDFTKLNKNKNLCKHFILFFFDNSIVFFKLKVSINELLKKMKTLIFFCVQKNSYSFCFYVS